MVLQRAPANPVIWGYAAEVGKLVEVGVNGETANTTTFSGQEGGPIWSVKLLPRDAASDPVVITAQYESCLIKLNDILFGDVYVCSGQSNMKFRMDQLDNPEPDIADAINYPNVRTFQVAQQYTNDTQYDVIEIERPWTIPDATNMASFSSICWLFGRDINVELGIPLGLIQSTHGGTRIEAWSSPEALDQCFPNGADPPKNPQNVASGLWNAMIHPLLRMPIFGVLWYQGETNASNGQFYSCSITVMVNDWRNRWFQETQGITNELFPFGQVQLGPHNRNNTPSNYNTVRWGQTTNLGYTPNDNLKNVFTAVAMDQPDVDSPYGPVLDRTMGNQLSVRWSANPTTYSLCTLAVCLLSYKWLTRPPSGFPPGPPSLPVVGSLPFIVHKDIRQSMANMAKKYGNVFSVDLGAQRLVVLNGYDVIKEALIKQGHVFAARPKHMLGLEFRSKYGVVFTNGHLWQEQRRYVLHLLRNYGFGQNTMEYFILEEVRHLLAELTKFQGKPHYPQQQLQKAASNVINTFAFGNRFDYQDQRFIDFVNSFEEITRLAAGFGRLNVFPFLKYFPGDLTGYKKIRSFFDTFENTFLKWYVEEKKAQLEAGQEQSDLIGSYLVEMKKQQAQDPNTHYTEDQLTWVIGDLFAAGTETTSTTLLWILLYLVLHQDVQTRMRKELDTVIGRDRLPALSDRLHLPYAEAFLCESQRLGDLVQFSLPHASVEDTILCGHRIPAGTNVMINLNSIHSDSEIYPEPLKFDPQRFLDEDGNFKKIEQLAPFSMGKRACMGESLARAELFLFTTSLVQHFTFSLPEYQPKPTMEPVIGQTTHPKAFEVIMQQRSTTIN